jgi:hypothetical protein
MNTATRARLTHPLTKLPIHRREIAKAHGGVLRVASDVSETRFTLIIPAAVTHPPLARPDQGLRTT